MAERDADCPAHDTRCTPDACRADGSPMGHRTLAAQMVATQTVQTATLRAVSYHHPSDADVLATFDHHQPTEEQIARILNVRRACKDAARAIQLFVPPSADRTVALRKMHEAMMTANKAIVCEEPTNG